MELASIASGSSGNCIYIGNRDSHFLVDAGISRKRIVEGLEEMEIKPENIDGILSPTSIWTTSADWVYSCGNIRCRCMPRERPSTVF